MQGLLAMPIDYTEDKLVSYAISFGRQAAFAIDARRQARSFLHDKSEAGIALRQINIGYSRDAAESARFWYKMLRKEMKKRNIK